MSAELPSSFVVSRAGVFQRNELATVNVARLKPEDPDWEPYLGSKFLRARHEYGHFLKSLPDNTKAWEKMGIIPFLAPTQILSPVFSGTYLKL